MAKRLAIFSFLLLVLVGKSFGQIQEMTPEDAKRIPPLPPVGIILGCVNGKVDVSWKPYVLETVSRYGHYVVYRSRNKGHFVKIAVVKQSTHFTDKRSRRGDSYALSAVNNYKVESQLSVPVKLKTSCK